MSPETRPPGLATRAAATVVPDQRKTTQKPTSPDQPKKQAVAPDPEAQFVVKGLQLLDQLGPQARCRAELVRVRCGDPISAAVDEAVLS